ncbi:MAG TPA: ferritin [Spirochaetia bacterium]|jgi:ferritin|nr:ferritin [Spirochaetia bacterium]
MKIQEKMEAALNGQIMEEMSSAYLYLAMAADFEAKNWTGFAAWMKVQAGEEFNHAMKLYGFINERGGRAVFKALPQPQGTWDSPLAAFEAAYKHENHITKCIDDLVKMAREMGDTATEIFLHWYVDEQVEEEMNADVIVEKLKLMKESANGLYLLDKELGARGKN